MTTDYYSPSMFKTWFGKESEYIWFDDLPQQGTTITRKDGTNWMIELVDLHTFEVFCVQ